MSPTRSAGPSLLSSGESWLRRALAQRLEVGAWRGPSALLASRMWGALASSTRRLELPPGLRVIGVGSATLGGSYKTPMVRALAREFAKHGPVAVVAHAYRARPGRARVVRPDDAVSDVGDEALELARDLGTEATVVVASDRRSALDLAARHARVAIVDGLLQTRPRRLAASLLVLDASRSWTELRCPPAGDARARHSDLLAACDVVAVGPTALEGTASSEAVRSRERAGVVDHARPAGPCMPVCHFEHELPGARTADGALVSWDELSRLRLGVVLAIARPERVLMELARRGVGVARVALAADHALPEPAARAATRGPGARLDAWLTTAKCATKLADRLEGVPVWKIEHRLSLPLALLQRLEPWAPSNRGEA